MPDICGRPLPREEGFTLVDLMASASIIVVGLVALVGVLLSSGRQQEQASLRHLVLNRAVSLMEEVRGADPGGLVATYDKQTFSVAGVTGTNQDGSAITVLIDATDPTLIEVTISGSWTALGNTETLLLTTQVFDSSA